MGGAARKSRRLKPISAPIEDGDRLMFRTKERTAGNHMKSVLPRTALVSALTVVAVQGPKALETPAMRSNAPVLTVCTSEAGAKPTPLRYALVRLVLPGKPERQGVTGGNGCASTTTMPSSAPDTTKRISRSPAGRTQRLPIRAPGPGTAAPPSDSSTQRNGSSPSGIRSGDTTPGGWWATLVDTAPERCKR